MRYAGAVTKRGISNDNAGEKPAKTKVSSAMLIS